ncbi:MAG: helix-turn-helix domain-containing protein [Burkholderiaceae bacterium]
MPRTNRERTDATRAALLDAARALFVDKGYEATSTPEVCEAAGMTRGALYHHFEDKRDLFRQVLARESASVTREIVESMGENRSARDALLAGTSAYLRAMAVQGRTRLQLVEGPAVLGLGETMALDAANEASTLREGLEDAGIGEKDVPLEELVFMLSAAFDRAAVAVDMGADAKRVERALGWLLDRVIADGK